MLHNAIRLTRITALNPLLLCTSFHSSEIIRKQKLRIGNLEMFVGRM